MRRKDRTIVPALADLSATAVVRGAMFFFSRLPKATAVSAAVRLARAVGPRLPRSAIGRQNLQIAFPHMSDSEREAILTGMWENLARSVIEYMHVDETFDFDPARPEAGRVTVAGADVFHDLRNAGKPAIIFTAHLATWELLGVCAAKLGLDVAALFRPPTNRFLAKSLFKARSRQMGPLIPSGRGVSLELAARLAAGQIIGVLVDQRFHGGVTVPFFGQLADSNPLAAKLARQYDCPVHGARAIRLPDGRIHLEIGEAIDLPRNDQGAIDVEAATATIQAIVEGWVREYPDQWIWVHRRWRFGKKTRTSPPRAGVASMQTD